MKGKIDKYIPYIKQRLFLRYTQVDALSSSNWDGAETLAYKHANKYDVVVACGGDGTVHQVINGVKKTNANCLIGILPFGTCNDIASTLKIPRKLDKAIDCILRLNTTKFDLMFDGSNYIVYSVATGYLTKTAYSASEAAKKKIGRMAYILSALKYIFKLKKEPLTITCDGERIHGKFVYFMLLNGECAGGFKLNKEDSVSDGSVKLVLIKKSKFCFLTFAKLFMFGIDAIRRNKSTIVRKAKIVEIENHSNSPFIVDGEKEKLLKKTITVNQYIDIIRK